MRVLIVDCFDSFTYNLYQLVGRMGGEPLVMRSDSPIEKVKEVTCDRVILSPGPGRPENAGISRQVIEELGGRVPILGVCLGHQVICTAFGGKVVHAPKPVHGKISPIRHNGHDPFQGLPNVFVAGRYHSLVAESGTLPDDLEVTALSLDDGCIMGIRHRHMPVYGIQFHPESILTPLGEKLMENFLFGCGR
ncbi:MAG: aminodeoxychorismate/anthranilate synthase component II [Methanomicrobiales archaeon]|nr:aminodeoxychorismate/anthranilate synthase component II [Methanomicrobiales archaeon]